MSSPSVRKDRTQRALVLVNSRARRGDGVSADVAAAFERAALPIDIVCPESAEAMGAAIRARCGGADRIVVAGGDGTVRGALADVIESGLPLGVIPLGTANDLARTLSLPTDIDGACRVIAEGHTRNIDVARANDAWFLNAASLGLSEAVTQRLTGAVKRKWGILGYAVCVYDAVRATRSFRLTLTCDGAVHRMRSIQCVVGNGRHYGGGATVAATATIDDGWLDVYSLDPQGIRELVAIALPLLAGRHAKLDRVRNFRCHAVRIESSRRRHVDTDGEMTTHTPVSVVQRPRLLEIFVRAESTFTVPEGE